MAGIILHPGNTNEDDRKPREQEKDERERTEGWVFPSEELYHSLLFDPDEDDDSYSFEEIDSDDSFEWSDDFSDDEDDEDDYENTVAILNAFDEIAEADLESTLGKDLISPFPFRMRKESLEKIGDSSKPVYDAEYIGKGTDGTSYCLCVSAKEEGAALHRRKKGESPEIFTDEKGWVPNPGLDKVYAILKRGGAEAELLFTFFHALDSSPFFHQSDSLLELLSSYRKLIQVREKLGSLARFTVVTGTDDTFTIVVVPADPYRVGSCLAWKDNHYALCQFYTKEQDILFLSQDEKECQDFSEGFSWDDGWGMEIGEKAYSDPDNGIPFLKQDENEIPAPREIAQEVYSESSEGEIIRVLRSLWDHASSSVICCLPISKNVCAESQNPYRESLKARFLDNRDHEGKQKMTEEEKKELRALRRFFSQPLKS